MLHLQLIHTASTVASHVLSDLPDPGKGTAPTGTAKAGNTLLGYLKYVCYCVCIAAGLVAAARLSFGGGRGDGGEHAARLGYVGVGAITVATVTGIIGGLITASGS